MTNGVVTAINVSGGLGYTAVPTVTIATFTVGENSGPQTINLTGITDGDNGTQILSVSAVSSLPSLIPNPVVTYSSPSTAGFLTFTPVANANGLATITVTVTDNGGVANGGKNTVSQSFIVLVTPTNSAPTINDLSGSNKTFSESNSSQSTTVTLGGISAGPGNNPTSIMVTAVSSNPALVFLAPNAVSYTSPSASGTLTYSVQPFTSGTATITVTVTDVGGSATTGTFTTTTSFTVTVNPVNQTPTLDLINNPNPHIPENSGPQTITLTGISAGVGDTTQIVNVFATSSDQTVIRNPAISYLGYPSTTATLTYTPLPNTNSNNQPVIITVTVADNSGAANFQISRTFGVTVDSINQPPTLDPIIANTLNPADPSNNITLPVNAGQQTINLSGITVGPGDTGQSITSFTATSSNPALIPDPGAIPIPHFPNTGSQFSYTPVAGQTGTAVITVTLMNSGGGNDTTIRTFTVAVGIPQGPVLAPSAGTATFVQGTAAILIDKGITLTDTGSPTITGATVAIANNFAAGEDVLALGFTDQNKITGVYDPTMGVLTLTGVDTVANYQLALESVTYQDTSNNPSVQPRDVLFTVNDGTMGPNSNPTGSAYVTVTVTPVNNLPTLDPIGTATAFATLAPSGGSILITLTNGGTGYSSATPPTVTLSGGTFTGAATATAVVNANGVVTAINVSGGTGYTTVPTVTITPPLAPVTYTFNENAGLQGILLSGISDGGSGTQPLTVTAAVTSSSTPGLIPTSGPGKLTVIYQNNSDNTNGAVTFIPLANTTGTATITVTVQDGASIFTRTFTVVISPVNVAPTLANITPPAAIPENTATVQTVNLTGISTGLGDVGQTVTSVTATTTNLTNPAGPPLITNLAVSYTPVAGIAVSSGGSGYTSVPSVTIMGGGGTGAMAMAVLNGDGLHPGVVTGITITNGGTGYTSIPTVMIAPPTSGTTAVATATITSPATATLTYNILPNAFGTATISVTVMDSGSNVAPNVNFVTKTFAVVVTQVNQTPTLNPFFATAVASLAPSTGSITIAVTNGGTGYTSPPVVNLTGGTFTSAASASAVLGTGLNAGTVVAINVTGGSGYTAVPTVVIAPPPPLTILENAGVQSVNLTGISPGAGDTGQTLTVTAVSNNPALIPNPVITGLNFTNPNSTGYVSFQPRPFTSGTATITVTVTDNGAAAIGGPRSVSQSFTVMVTPVDQAPTLNSIPNPAPIFENSGLRTINLSGISQGPGDTGQTLVVSAVSSNPAVIPNLFNGGLQVTYTSPSATGSISFTPVPGATTVNSNNVNTPVMITVTVADDGSTLNGGVNSVQQTFFVTVLPVNQQPTLSLALPGATATASLSGDSITIAVNNGGSGYISVPNVTLTGGTFTSPASAVAVVTNGVVTAINVSNGAGYTAVPTVTIDPAPITITENSTAVQMVGLSNIGPGTGEVQSINVFATSNNPGLITNPAVTYSSPSSTGMLSFTPVANASGTAVITVTAQDNGGTANGGINSISQSFTVVVTPINQAPTLNPIANPAPIFENTTALQTIGLTGITAGGNDLQNLTVSVLSNSNTTLLPNIAISYQSPNTTGTLSYVPAAFATGTATITVLVMDSGGTAGGGINTTTQTFTVTVLPINQAPTLNPIASPAPILENTVTPQVVNLSGITAGVGESQILTITAATSNNTGLIVSPVVSYISPNTTGTLTYTPLPNTSGTATIKVTVTDNGGVANGGINTTTQTFTVVVTPVNQAPTLNPIANPAPVAVNAGPQTVSLSGITAGPGDQGQTVSIKATSSNPALIPDPTVSYTNPGMTGSVAYTPVAGASGSATITVTVTDSGGTDNNGVNSFSQTFNVAVSPTNQAPVVTTTASNLTYIQGQGLDPVDPGLTVTDADSPNLNGATVAITANFVPTQDFLAFNDQLGITGSYNPTTGVLTLSGTTTPANYQAALRTVSYFNSSTNPMPPTRIVTFTANDGAAVNNLGTASRTIAITPVNIAPTLDVIPNPAPIFENAPVQTINLTGITAGGGQSQILSVTAVSNSTLIPLAVTAVSYTNPNTTGSITFTPAANAFGTATITVTVTDNGNTLNSGVNSFSRSFTVTVLPVNQAPSFAAIASPAAILENTSATQVIPLSTITAGPNETQNLNITAVSSNPALIPNPAVNYTSPSGSGSLSYAPLPNVSGMAIIIVTLSDDGGVANGGVNTFSQAFNVVVTPVNQAPTLNPIANPAPINENDSTPQTVNLSGITAGPGDTAQALTVTAVSSNQTLIPNPAVTYTSPDTIGTLNYAVAPNLSGTATITVTVTDSGSNVAPNVNNFSQTFTVVVNSVNQPPTINPVAGPGSVLENAGPQTINLSGITAGIGDTQNLTVTATSSQPAVIANPAITYVSPSKTGVLTFMPVADASSAPNNPVTITITVTDDGGTANNGVNTFSESFQVAVTPVNQPPTINPIANVTTSENTVTPAPVPLNGISPGLGDTGQTVMLSAVSSNTALIPNPRITYPTTDNATGALNYQLVPNVSGTATITVTLTDNGGTANGGMPTFSRTFIINVTPINQPPTLNPITPNPLSLPLNSPPQSVPLSGITDGNGGTETISVTATSSNPSLIPITSGSILYTSPLTTGTLILAPVANGVGVATITVTVTDTGGSATTGTFTTSQSFTVAVATTIVTPIVTTSTSPLAYLQGQGAVPLDPGVTVTDANSPTLIGATVAITSSFASGQDVLGFTNQNGISGTFNANLGVLTLTGTATLANYQAALQSVTYNNTSSNPSVLTRVATFTANDGAALNNLGSGFRQITVNQVNVAPTLNPITNPKAILENTTTPVIIPLTNITVGGNQIQNILPQPSATNVNPPFGVVAVSDNQALIADSDITISYTPNNTTGTLAFTPEPNAFGTANITVTVTDDGGTANGGVNTFSQTFTVTVISVNLPPTLAPIINPATQTNNFTVAENTPASQITPVMLMGIGNGGGVPQNLTVIAVSSSGIL